MSFVVSMKKLAWSVGLTVLLAAYVGAYAQLRKSGQLLRTHAVFRGPTEGTYRDFEAHIVHNRNSRVATVGVVVGWPLARLEELLCEQTNWLVSEEEKIADAERIERMLKNLQSNLIYFMN